MLIVSSAAVLYALWGWLYIGTWLLSPPCDGQGNLKCIETPEEVRAVAIVVAAISAFAFLLAWFSLNRWKRFKSEDKTAA